jgi:hypothetical protein
VRRCLVYVLANFKKHIPGARGLDPRSSAAWFAGSLASDGDATVSSIPTRRRGTRGGMVVDDGSALAHAPHAWWRLTHRRPGPGRLLRHLEVAGYRSPLLPSGPRSRSSLNGADGFETSSRLRP